MKHNVLEFTHIEKTAGTSMRSILEKNLGPEHVSIYSPLSKRFSKSADNLQPQTSASIELVRRLMNSPYVNPIFSNIYPLIERYLAWKMQKQNPELSIPIDTKCVMGHFITGEFDVLTENPVRTIMLRNPLDRMYSMYSHWKTNKGHTDWRVRIPYSDDITFEEYAFNPALQNYQFTAMGGFDLNDFEVVGLSEYSELFVEQLLQCLIEYGLISDVVYNTNERLNVRNSHLPEEYYNPLFVEAFTQFHECDYMVYTELYKRMTYEQS